MRVRNRARYLPWLAAIFTLGCVHGRQTVTPEAMVPPAAATLAVTPEAQAGPAITDNLSVADPVRSGYEAAVRLLERAQY
jgi:hypothetical protein